ncbi:MULTISPECIES: FxSxx-COOH cyclophane-containing RiPP peptide [unclassified Streptomyces]|uniref:FxSxx-COOH cyclophane-containing RiPP peptide n=1 Tax=unclassified Streptomyces TaxID=2593676 RepID=UPI00278C0070|nr:MULTISPECIES: FxSxx-COOH cyclophane-containing RiPP peptide [unclassified Streptomyces]
MNAHDEPRDATGEPAGPPEGPPEGAPEGASDGAPGGPLPDLTTLALKDLTAVEHPVLREVLGELRERVERPGETLWGFNSSFG